MYAEQRDVEAGPGRPSSPQPNPEAWWDILAASENAADFHRAWLSLQCVRIGGVHAALILVEKDAGAFVTAAAWPAERIDFTHLAPCAQQCLMLRRSLIQHGAANAPAHLAYPLEIDGRLQGAVVLELRERPDDALQEALQALRWGSGWLRSAFLRAQGQDDAQSLARARIALDVLALAAEEPRLPDFALVVANDLASRFACERVAFGVDRAGRARLVALSHSAVFERNSQFVASLENAMDEALDQRRSLAWPAAADAGEPGSTGSGGLAIAQRDFAGQRAVCSVLLLNGGQGIGVLTLERNSGLPFGADEIRCFEAIGAILGPLVASRMELGRWVAGRLADHAGAAWRHLKDPRRPAFRALLAAGALVLLGPLFVEGEHRVGARSVVEGEIQRAVVAPFEGFVREAPVRAGMLVRQGQLLARLDERDLLLEQRRHLAEREQHQRRYRGALSRHERTEAEVSLAQVAEADSRLALVEEKLSRARIVAPFDGILVSGDLSQLLGSPVEQGKLLFEVAPLDAYRVILKVDDRDIRDVRAGQAGRLVLSGLAGEVLDFKVHTISMAQAEDGKNLFRVEARLARSDLKLRPGMEGVGKITIGERSYAWIWTHHLLDWLRLQAWTWLP